MPRLRALLVLPAGLVLLAACGDPSTEPGNAPTTAAPTGTGSAPGSSPTGTRTTVPVPSAPTDLPTASGKQITVEGIVEEGVEPGCMVLTSGEVSYLILGGQDVPTGVPVRVVGVLQPGVLSTCQQGTPLRVTKAERR